MPNQQPRTMRVLGTSLPSSQTVHERVFGPAPRGRPLVIPPRNLALKKDASRPVGYRMLWQKIKPPQIEAAERQMGVHMPPGLTPDVIRRANRRA